MSNQTKTKSTDTRAKAGRWKKGASGNPAGRPSGSRNKATLVIEQLLDGEAEDLCRQAINLAKKGNIQALRLCLERVIPIRKERSIELDLPPAQNTQDLAANLQRIVVAVGEGRITPGEAQALSEVVSSQAHLFETADMERRLQALEGRSEEVRASRQELDSQVQRFSSEDHKLSNLAGGDHADDPGKRAA